MWTPTAMKTTLAAALFLLGTVPAGRRLRPRRLSRPIERHFMSTPPRLDELSTRTGGMESLPLRQRHLVPFPAFLRQRTVEDRAALVKQIDFVGKLLGPRRHRDLNDPIISHASLLWFCENDPQVHEPEGGLARPRAERAVGRPPPFERHSHVSARRQDSLAGAAGLELANVAFPTLSYLFDISQRFCRN